MYALRGSTVPTFGYDQTGTVSYRFNRYGFRSPYEFGADHPNPVIILGNSISFGVGLTYEHTYAGRLEELFGPVFNFSFGCYLHENSDQIAMMTEILEGIIPKVVIVQINNLNRVRDPAGRVVLSDDLGLVLGRFEEYLSLMENLLQGIPHGYLYWDEVEYPISVPNLITRNKFHVDRSLPNVHHTFGAKSHALITKAVAGYVQRL